MLSFSQSSAAILAILLTVFITLHFCNYFSLSAVDLLLSYANKNVSKVRLTLVFLRCGDFRSKKQGRLLHINDGANAPWKKCGEAFLQKLRGKCIYY